MLNNLGAFNDPIIILCVILLAAILLDLIMGDPLWLLHPVVVIGKLISSLEQRWNRGENRVGKGIILTTTVIIIVYFVTLFIVLFAYQVHPVAGILVEVYFISTTIAIKGLRSAALNVKNPLVLGNLVAARKNVSMIIGRDTKNLSESEVIRGTVETVAENTVDGITAPLFWAIIGGGPLAMVYRAINTLDSMVGYKNEKYMKFGWASAKLDDVVNWVPARLTALAMWVAAFFIKGSKKKHGWKITWRDAKKHPSPNSGWSEAMVAGLLGIQLGGTNYYCDIKSVRSTMGDPLRELVRSDIEKSILYMHGSWIVFFSIGVCFLFLLK